MTTQHEWMRQAARRIEELLGELERARQLAAELEAEIAECPSRGFHRGFPYFEDGTPTAEELA